MRNLICTFIHHADGEHSCNRCGEVWESRDGGVAHWPYLEQLQFRYFEFKHRQHRRIRDLMTWWRCEDCGGRYGVHSLRCDHDLPF